MISNIAPKPLNEVKKLAVANQCMLQMNALVIGKEDGRRWD
jgi:hypothetical protein